MVNSSLNRIKPDQTDGTISFESPRDKADTVLARRASCWRGDAPEPSRKTPTRPTSPMRKEGFAITLASMATAGARETIASTLMPGGKMADAYRAVRGGRPVRPRQRSPRLNCRNRIHARIRQTWCLM